MARVPNVSFDEYPAQANIVSRRVVVYYDKDKTKFHYGTIVRADRQAPYETLIALDNGHYVRSAECRFEYISEDSNAA